MSFNIFMLKKQDGLFELQNKISGHLRLTNLPNCMNLISTTKEHVRIDVLQTATGKTPVEWHLELQQASKSFKSIDECASLLVNTYGLRPDLASRIAEMHYALRVKPEAADEGIELSTVTRTFPLGIHTVESYFSEPELRESWLERDFTPTQRNVGRSMRFEGAFPGKVLVNFNGKGPEKCQITIQHLKLADREQAEEIRMYWKSRLELLASVLNCK